MKKMYSSKSSHKAFTLIELMFVVIIVGLLAAIALPSYQNYIRKSHLALAQQEMQKLSEQLERHKAKNFSYKGYEASYLYKDKAGVLSTSFDTTKQELKLPLNSTAPTYKLSIIGFYSVSELEKQPDGTSKAKDLVIKTDLLNKKIELDKTKMDDLYAIGSNWAIKAESLDSSNYTLLVNSLGARCMNKKDTTKVTFSSCGTKGEGSESW